MRGAKLLQSVLLEAAVVALCGCFVYREVPMDVVPASGTGVRATLTAPSAFDMGGDSVEDVTQVEGTVVQPGPDSLGVWVRWFRPRVGPKYDAQQAEFFLRRASMSRLETWAFSPKRTALTGALSGVALFGLYRLFKLVGEAQSGIHGPPGGNH